MNLRRAATPLATVVLLAASATAFAKGGGGADPVKPAPVTTPCVTATGVGGGVVHGNKTVKPQFQVTNCSTLTETVVPHFSDHAMDAFGLGRNCGPDQAWNGAAFALGAGKTTTVNTVAVRAACPSAEAHTITLTFTTPAGAAVPGVGYFGWSDSITP